MNWHTVIHTWKCLNAEKLANCKRHSRCINKIIFLPESLFLRCFLSACDPVGGRARTIEWKAQFSSENTRYPNKHQCPIFPRKIIFSYERNWEERSEAFCIPTLFFCCVSLPVCLSGEYRNYCSSINTEGVPDEAEKRAFIKSDPLVVKEIQNKNHYFMNQYQ